MRTVLVAVLLALVGAIFGSVQWSMRLEADEITLELARELAAARDTAEQYESAEIANRQMGDVAQIVKHTIAECAKRHRMPSILGLGFDDAGKLVFVDGRCLPVEPRTDV